MSGFVMPARNWWRDWLWFYVTLGVLCFVIFLSTGHGEEPQRMGTPARPSESGKSAQPPKVVYVGASWCAPCKGAKQFTIPAIEAKNITVEQLDYDLDDKRLPGPIANLPAWFVMIDGKVIDYIEGHVHQDLVLRHYPTTVAASSPARQEPRPPGPGPPDIVAQLRKFLGTTKPRSHSSLAWSFEEAAAIELDAKTQITRPKLLSCECDFHGDVLTVTFAEPLPQAHVVKAGATISFDVPRVTIKGNIVTATADVAFGIQKDFEFTITKSPF